MAPSRFGGYSSPSPNVIDATEVGRDRQHNLVFLDSVFLPMLAALGNNRRANAIVVDQWRRSGPPSEMRGMDAERRRVSLRPVSIVATGGFASQERASQAAVCNTDADSGYRPP